MQALLPVTRAHANQILARLARKGWLLRINRGAYTVVPLGALTPAASIKDAHALAMALFAPCYIAGWSAAEHWELTEQIFNAVAVVTARPQRHHTRKVAGISFVCRVVEASAIFGTERVWSGTTQIEIADPHRLVIDILNAPELGGGARHTLDIVRNYWRSKHASPERLIEYAKRFGKGVVFQTTRLHRGETRQRIGRLDRTVPGRDDEGCERPRPEMVPSAERSVSKWRLRINVPVEQT